MLYRFLALIAVGSTLAACSSDSVKEKKREVGAGEPPVANLVATPDTGLAPLSTTLDARASLDAEDPLSKLVFRWDVDGDGTWDTDFAPSPTYDHTYTEPGAFKPAVEVRDLNKNVTSATTSLFVLSGDAVFVDIDADIDRDGTVGDLDDAGEELFDNTRGAMLLANLDDDDSDGERDSITVELDNAADVADTAPLVLRRIQNLTSVHEVTVLFATDAEAARMRVFWPNGDDWVAINDGVSKTAVIDDPEALRDGDVTLRVEATTGRSGKWNGYSTVTIQVSEGGEVVGEDTVQFRVAPTILPDNTQPADALYVMRIQGDNNAFYNSLESNLPANVSLYTVRSAMYGYDRWVQDNMQTGYQEVLAGGERRVVQTYVQLQRPTGNFGLESLLPGELLDAELGFTYQGGNDTSHNYGGNLEVTPSFAEFPYGRILIGGGSGGTLTGRSNTDRMTAVQHEWLDAQEVQGPAVELSSEWLAVGHIDEIFQFVPDPSSTDDTPFKLVIASPALARQALEELVETAPDAIVFEDRDAETTVEDILDDDRLLTFNVAAQARIDTVRLALIELMGLTEDDIIDVPVLFEEVAQTGGLAVAYNPGVQNLVTVNDTLFIPDPEGPNGENGDIWQKLISDELEPLGLTVHYVDVFESYHELMGEAHCGTNVQLGSYATAWWEL